MIQAYKGAQTGIRRAPRPPHSCAFPRQQSHKNRRAAGNILYFFPATIAQKPPRNREHPLPDIPRQISRLLPVRANPEGSRHVPAQVLHLVHPRVQELRRRRSQRNHHHRLPPREVGIRDSRVERVPFQAVVCPFQLNTPASGFGKVLQYVIRAVHGDGVIYPYAPSVIRYAKILYNHCLTYYK